MTRPPIDPAIPARRAAETALVEQTGVRSDGNG
jgi:hypothetical protein